MATPSSERKTENEAGGGEGKGCADEMICDMPMPCKWPTGMGEVRRPRQPQGLSSGGCGPKTEALTGTLDGTESLTGATGWGARPTHPSLGRGDSAVGLDGLIFFQLPHGGLWFYGKSRASGTDISLTAV